jgi:hypothetical protein
MEKIIVFFSIPIFLVLVLLIAVFVLAHYSGNEPTGKAAQSEVKAPEAPDRSEGADRLAT